MNKINKILIISVFVCCFALNLVLADSTDCWTFAVDTYKKQDWKYWFDRVNQVWETDKEQYSKFLTVDQQKLILTKNDLNTAILNLKKYCCEKNKWWLSQKTCDDDKASFNPNAMDSEYLFDHIFDVMMRRLAWLTGDKNIYVKSNMTEVDDMWGKRREFITDKAEDLSWSDAQSIIDEYQKYWVKSKPNLWYDITEEVDRKFGPNSDSDFLKSVTWDNWIEWDKSGKVAEAMKNYDKWTLYDRYSNACAMSKYFYALLDYPYYDKNSDRWNFVKRLADWPCENATQTQIENENYYVQTVVQNSANLFMENYIEWYLQYLYDRSNKLKDIWRSSENRWVDVIRAIPYLLKNCVH